MSNSAALAVEREDARHPRAAHRTCATAEVLGAPSARLVAAGHVGGVLGPLEAHAAPRALLELLDARPGVLHEPNRLLGIARLLEHGEELVQVGRGLRRELLRPPCRALVSLCPGHRRLCVGGGLRVVARVGLHVDPVHLRVRESPQPPALGEAVLRGGEERHLRATPRDHLGHRVQTEDAGRVHVRVHRPQGARDEVELAHGVRGVGRVGVHGRLRGEHHVPDDEQRPHGRAVLVEHLLARAAVQVPLAHRVVQGGGEEVHAGEFAVPEGLRVPREGAQAQGAPHGPQARRLVDGRGREDALPVKLAHVQPHDAGGVAVQDGDGLQAVHGLGPVRLVLPLGRLVAVRGGVEVVDVQRAAAEGAGKEADGHGVRDGRVEGGRHVLVLGPEGRDLLPGARVPHADAVATGEEPFALRADPDDVLLVPVEGPDKVARLELPHGGRVVPAPEKDVPIATLTDFMVRVCMASPSSGKVMTGALASMVGFRHDWSSREDSAVVLRPDPFGREERASTEKLVELADRLPARGRVDTRFPIAGERPGERHRARGQGACR
eukprot:CAMPEP_0206006186 /NCGR_PEP_ID=MMETSP1464-20131121/5028_1 /ASSEMBLY_ACC=CAM_ASM_001124 /TAXON_ID=119497 /ORGANISM="Exanthemachrysis gayraliae, Strain RCC1523" /LENGTH=551 /DNA_ID=CAMNT_0053379653 /DNA_START=759 /DNA_END=2410 /DNA_ORIENTATION=-